MESLIKILLSKWEMTPEGLRNEWLNLRDKDFKKIVEENLDIFTMKCLKADNWFYLRSINLKNDYRKDLEINIK